LKKEEGWALFFKPIQRDGLAAKTYWAFKYPSEKPPGVMQQYH
jgi:hypothetical protein